MTTIVDVQLIEGLGLPYAPGAEAGLLDAALDPIFNDAWQAFVATFPGLTLLPLFDDLPVEQLADLVDGIRVGGDEPPDPFVWFTLSAMTRWSMRSSPRCRRCRWWSSPSSGSTPSSRPPSRTARIPMRTGRCRSSRRPTASTRSMRGRWPAVPAMAFASPTSRADGAWITTSWSRRASASSRCSGPNDDRPRHGRGRHRRRRRQRRRHDRHRPQCRARSGHDEARSWAASHRRQRSRSRPRIWCAATSCCSKSRIPFRPANTSPTSSSSSTGRAGRAFAVATLRGITVIEPAGNGGIDLDAFPFLAHTRPGSRTSLTPARSWSAPASSPDLRWTHGRARSRRSAVGSTASLPEPHSGAIERRHELVPGTSVERPEPLRSSPAWPRRCRR